MSDETGRLEVLCRRAILTFAEALAVTPADQPARRQPYQYGRKSRVITRREVLIDGVTGAGDLLLMAAESGRGPDA